jgi:N-acetylmuramoyl-L-alanine amidase
MAVLKRMQDLKFNEFGNVDNFNFVLNSPTDFPNTLVEVAFLSNEEDEQK